MVEEPHGSRFDRKELPSGRKTASCGAEKTRSRRMVWSIELRGMPSIEMLDLKASVTVGVSEGTGSMSRRRSERIDDLPLYLPSVSSSPMETHLSVVGKNDIPSCSTTYGNLFSRFDRE